MLDGTGGGGVVGDDDGGMVDMVVAGGENRDGGEDEEFGVSKDESILTSKRSAGNRSHEGLAWRFEAASWMESGVSPGHKNWPSKGRTPRSRRSSRFCAKPRQQPQLVSNVAPATASNSAFSSPREIYM